MRRALQRRDAVPITWRWEPLPYAAYLLGRALVRLEGTAHSRGTTHPWRVVVKIFERVSQEEVLATLANRSVGRNTAPATAGVPATARTPATRPSLNREIHAYRSGLLRRLPAGLAAPRLLHHQITAQGAVWLWLEHVEDAFEGKWPLEHFAIAARHLGRFNGSFTHEECPLPHRWLNGRWAESHSQPTIRDEARSQVEALLALPAVGASLTPGAEERIRRVFVEQDLYIKTLARLPQALAHHDASSANLFARRLNPSSGTAPAPETWETVAIDWEDVGYGPLGAEIATLVFGSIRRGAFSAARAAELEHTSLSGYFQGLADADWHGDPNQVRVGFTLAVALRWFVIPAALRALADPASLERTAADAGQPVASLREERAGLMYYLLDCATEARRLTRAL